MFLLQKRLQQPPRARMTTTDAELGDYRSQLAVRIADNEELCGKLFFQDAEMGELRTTCNAQKVELELLKAKCEAQELELEFLRKTCSPQSMENLYVQIGKHLEENRDLRAELRDLKKTTTAADFLDKNS